MRSMRPFVRRVVFALIALNISIALCGCTSLRLKFGWRVSLTKVPVVQMEAGMPGGERVAPGEKAPMVVKFTQPDGKVLLTEGAGHGKVMWKEIAVDADVVSVNKKGVVRLPEDPRLTEGKTGHVKVTVPSHPDLKQEFDVGIRYDYAYSVRFQGSSGFDGLDGTDGTSGSSGSMGSFDTGHPSAGGDGGDGTNGTDGDNGGAGSDGPPVEVRLVMERGTAPLVQAEVWAEGRERFYLIDPQGGSLEVDSYGGSGGHGGRGGRGGSGGSGGAGIPPGHDGSSGLDGQDGSDGPDGNAGRITVIYNPEVKPFLGILTFNHGADVRYREEMLAPLW